MNVVAGQEAEKDFTMTAIPEKLGSVSGTVTIEGKADPLEGVEVRIGLHTAMTNEDGDYSIPDVPVGMDQIITGTLDGYINYDGIVTVEPETDTKKNFSMAPVPPGTGFLTGFVTDIVDQPLHNVLVSIDGKRIRTRKNGYYTISGITAGWQEVVAIRPGYERYTEEINITADTIKEHDFSMESTVYEYVFDKYIGVKGQIHTPSAIAVDSAGRIYVGNENTCQIQVFSPDGVEISAWGGPGDGDGNIVLPRGIAVLEQGDDLFVYVVDDGQNCIKKFKQNDNGELSYEFVTKWGKTGDGNGDFKSPRGIAVFEQDGDVFVYVGENIQRRIQKFKQSDEFTYDYVTQWNGAEGGGELFDLPESVAVIEEDGGVFVLVADRGWNRIQKFRRKNPTTYELVIQWGEFGDGDGLFKGPKGIAVDSHGAVYVADTNNHRIQMFDSGGKFLTKWGELGDGDSNFNEPNLIAVDSHGAVYVTDWNNSSVKKFVRKP